ncbi:MAG: FAD-binding protein, partial [Actinomycetes bacterium]
MTRPSSQPNATWRNWCGLAAVDPVQVATPADTSAVADAVTSARDRGLSVKMVGSGHSFTDIGVADGVMLRP